MPTLTDEDKDNIIRTIIGEVDPKDPDQGRAAVAHVILNRAISGRYPSTPTGVVQQRGQFESWDARGKELSSIKRDSPEYKHAASILDGVLDGTLLDPTNGATHFLDRKIVSGRPGGIQKLAPWADEHPALAQIGGHTFYAPEGAAHWGDTDLLAQYTSPAPRPPVAAPDKALLDQYLAPPKQAAPGQVKADDSSVPPEPPTTFPNIPPMPTSTSTLGRIGYSLRDFPGLAASAASRVMPATPEGLSSIGDALSETGTGIADAFRGGVALTKSGLADLSQGIQGPSFPSRDPRTWGAGGILKTAGGVLGTVASPLTGAIKANIEDPATRLTGNEDFGTKLGMVAGGIVPGGPAARGAAGVARRMAPTTSALDRLVEMVGPENIPAAVARLRANPRLNIMDISDPVRVASQGLIDPDQPTAQRILSQSAKDRAATAPTATNEAYSSTFGPVPDVEKYVDGLKKKAQVVGREIINPVVANTKSVDITPIVRSLDNQIGYRVLNNIREGRDVGVPLTNLQKDLLEIRDRLRGDLPDRPATSKTVSDTMLMDANQAHEIQSQLRYEGSTLLKAGGQDALRGGRFMDARQKLVEAIDAASPPLPVPAGHTRYYRLTDTFSGEHKNGWFTTNPTRAKEFGDGKFVDIADNDTATLAKFNAAAGMKDVKVTKDPDVARNVQDLTNQYKPALAKYRDAKHVQEAFEDGLETLKNRQGLAGIADRPESLMRWLLQASPEEEEARKVGTRVAIDQSVNSVRGAARKGMDIPDIPFNRAKLSILFGRGEADRLFSLMQDARDEAITNSKLIQGSKTAETTAGQKALSPRPVVPFSVSHNALGLPGAIGLAGLMTPYPEIGGLAALGIGAANIGGAAVKSGVSKLAHSMDMNRNIEFSRLATSTGGENNPIIPKLLSHPAVKGNLPATIVPPGPTVQSLPLQRPVISRGRGGRPIVSGRLGQTSQP